MPATFDYDRRKWFYTCEDCGRDGSRFERRAQFFCDEHLLATADRRAYERWFIERIELGLVRAPVVEKIGTVATDTLGASPSPEPVPIVSGQDMPPEVAAQLGPQA